VLDEFHGSYINIDTDGIRQTPNFADNSAKTIYFFGGSTMWGEGARDNYTIAGHVARLLYENDTPQKVVNYGQTGYVSTQDLIWFQLQLLQGDIPDVAVFYQGFNDVLAAWGNDAVGVTLQENMRLNDAEAGRKLRAGQPVLSLPNFKLTQLDLSQAAVSNVTAENIANRWFANVEMLEALADSYGVKVLFAWQPAIIFKDTLSESEQAIYQRTENERSGLFSLYADVDAIVRERLAGGDYENIVLLGDLFVDIDEALFHDLVHITEVGNAYVAEAIVPYLNTLLEEN
jgi:lysophospholipase L1-like esterase